MLCVRDWQTLARHACSCFRLLWCQDQVGWLAGCLLLGDVETRLFRRLAALHTKMPRLSYDAPGVHIPLETRSRILYAQTSPAPVDLQAPTASPAPPHKLRLLDHTMHTCVLPTWRQNTMLVAQKLYATRLFEVCLDFFGVVGMSQVTSDMWQLAHCVATTCADDPVSCTGCTVCVNNSAVSLLVIAREDMVLQCQHAGRAPRTD